MTALTAAERAVLDWLAGERAAMLDLIEALVNTDSGSFDKAGVDAVGGRIGAFFRARVGASAGANTGVLLMGHRDTVYPRGEAARRPFRVADGRGYGPGCCDMKAGLAVNALVLSAFAKFGAPGTLVGLFTADEEIGSPSSQALIEEEAR